MQKKKPVRRKKKAVTQKSPAVILTVDQQSQQKKQLTLLPLFLKSICLSFLFAFMMLALTALVIAGFIYHKSLQFTQPAQTSLIELIQTGYAGWQRVPDQNQGKITFLILGSDELANRDSERPLTDTVMLASLNLDTVQVNLLSLPRDIWIPTFKTKINALYALGLSQNASEPAKLSKEVVTELTGVPIQHTVVIKLKTLSELVDIVGGVDVNVKESFTDPLFPRSDVDVTKVHDPKLLYETVSFASGSTHMSGSEVLKYVRSRHATGIEGSDNARGSRQQDVILALIEKFKDQRFWYDLHRDGLLYQFYVANFSQYLPIQEAVAIAHQLLPHLTQLGFTEGTPGIYPDIEDGVIFHPTSETSKYFGAWVYEVKDLKLFKAEAQRDLHY